MTDHDGLDRSARRTRLLRHRSALSAPHPPHSCCRRGRGVTAGRPAAARTSCTQPDPIPRASLDDYLGGRSDRMGRDLLIDLRPPAGPARWPLTCAMPLAAPREILFHVRRLRPDLVWLYTDDLERAQVVARRIAAGGVETIIIHEPDEDC